MPVFAILTLLPWMLLSGVQPRTPDLGNACATCHMRSAWTRSTTTHVDLWVTSKHAFYRVGCEKCHGGDARTSDAAAAHRGVVNSADPSSRVHRAALPETCGQCHRTEAGGFEQSAHRKLLSRGDTAGPTCTSCHTSMATDVPSLAALEKQCLQCHHDDPQNRGQIARRELEEWTRLRNGVRRAKLEIDTIKEAERRTALTQQWTDADQSLPEVLARIHAFDLTGVDDRLSGARARLDRLLADLGRR
jgi:hypothetical protein